MQQNASKNPSPTPSIDRPTPMMEQYIEIKAAHSDYMLFYRMGDFYELFFDDALDAARALGITLTKRGKHLGEDIPMCGVPVHTADDYLQRLISSGYRVAVCEQVENPAEAKKRGAKSVVKRDVVRLVTPGTLTEEKLLDPGASNYLMALGHIKEHGETYFSLAWIDISTGVFKVSQSNLDLLLGDIMRVAPKELLVGDQLFHDPNLKTICDTLGRIITIQSQNLFDHTTATTRICNYFKVATLSGFAEFSKAELVAISGAIAYIEKTQINERPPLMRPEREFEGSTLFIDPATRIHLELSHTLSGDRHGSLLKAIDRTVTNGGARLLGERLMTPLTNPIIINQRLDSVAFLLNNSELRDCIRIILQGIPDMPRAISRLGVERGGPRDLMAISTTLSAALSLSEAIDNVLLPYELSQALQTIKKLPLSLYTHLERVLADELPILKRDGGFVRTGYHQELDDMRALRDETRRVIAALQARYMDETGIKNLKIKHNNVLGYFIEVTVNQSTALTSNAEAKARFIHRQTMSNAMRFTTIELADLESRIANAADKALTIELEIFAQLESEVINFADLLRDGATALSLFDVATSLALLAEEQGYCRPMIDNSLACNIIAGRHPVVEQTLRKKASDPFVANDCNLSPNNNEQFGQIWLLTGPNMGGKSTFLRQNALIIIMAQMGSFVSAGSADIGIVDRLFSRVGASDDIVRGRSTFMVEMVETAAILNQAGERALVILDEIGRGTSTFDGLSIAWASVEYLHEVNHCRTLFATHFHEMTVLSEKLSRLHNHTMKVREWKGDVIFLHEVSAGAADRSYGIQVAKLAGLPNQVISRARSVLKQLEDSEQFGKANKLIDNLPLFSVTLNHNANHEDKVQQSSTIAQALEKINPDILSPREALEELYQLKALLKQA